MTETGREPNNIQRLQQMADHQQRNRVVKCANCGKREGTIRWGDTLALTHGWAQMWCEVCALEAQLEYAKERAAAIPELEARLQRLHSQASDEGHHD